MAHFAELDNNNVVLQVLVVPDFEEHRGDEYLSIDCGLGGRWIQTSYTGRIRKNFASIGMKYDLDRDAFIMEKVYASWVFDEELCQWKAPIPYPENGKPYVWDEDSVSWIEIERVTPPNLVLDIPIEQDAADLAHFE
jgi:hypothetical protein